MPARRTLRAGLGTGSVLSSHLFTPPTRALFEFLGPENKPVAPVVAKSYRPVPPRYTTPCFVTTKTGDPSARHRLTSSGPNHTHVSLCNVVVGHPRRPPPEYGMCATGYLPVICHTRVPGSGLQRYRLAQGNES